MGARWDSWRTADLVPLRGSGSITGCGGRGLDAVGFFFDIRDEVPCVLEAMMAQGDGAGDSVAEREASAGDSG
jgi:hypothetical protein